MAVFRKNEIERETEYPVQNKIERVRTLIGKTLFIKGEFYSEEEVLIEGKVEGQLDIKHKVIIGKNGIVNADIEGREIIIRGRVNGNVKGSYKVEIEPEGVLNGNIISQRVVLAEGAIFKGNIDMSSDEKSSPEIITPAMDQNKQAKPFKKV